MLIPPEDSELQIKEQENLPKLELTQKEKAVIDQAIPLIGLYKPYLIEQNALFEVASMGNKVLPYIKGKIREYEFSRLVDLLAGDQNLDLIFESLESAISSPDGSTAVNLLNALRRIIFSIRSQTPNDPKLSEIFNKLSKILTSKIASGSARTETYQTIAITGILGADKYIEEALENDLIDSIYANNLKKYTKDISSIPKSVVKIRYVNELILKLGKQTNTPDPKKEKLNQFILETPLENESESEDIETEPGDTKETEEKQPGQHILRIPEDTKDEGEEPPKQQTEFDQFPEALELPVFPVEYINLFQELEELHEKYQDQEGLIKAMEEKLGIESNMQRTLEAALLIDWKFLCTGIIAGQSAVERMFGEKQWMDWVTARLAARAYGDNLLTVDFITFVHQCLTKKANPTIGGDLRYYSVQGADYQSPSDPVTYTNEQIKAIKDNPLLEFHQRGGPNTGFIRYPYRTNQNVIGQLSQESREFFEKQPNYKHLVEALLMDLCTWYNSERKKPHDPYKLAAELQHKLISIHPFQDVNGRVSRLLMDWSLENEGKKGAILFEPGEDILLSEVDWQSEVMMGSRLHSSFKKRRKKLEAIGYEDQAEVLGISGLKTFYDMVFKHIMEAPKTPKDEEVLSHKTYEEFIEKFQKEYERFREDFSRVRNDRYGEYAVYRYPQGDLIPESFLGLITVKPEDALCYHNYLKRYFFTEMPVYRGGACSKVINEQDVIRMFESYIGVGTGYKALSYTYTSPISDSTISPGAIARSLDNYNQLLAKAYFTKYYPGKEFQPGYTLGEVISAHVEMPEEEKGKRIMFASPFASSSKDEYISELWSKKSDVKGTKSGILFKALAPSFGGIMTYGRTESYYWRYRSDLPGLDNIEFAHPHEQEILVPGGINPFSIDQIKVIKHTKHFWQVSFTAKKQQTGEGVFLVIDDKEKSQRTKYRLNPNTGHYEFIESGVIPS